MDLSWGAAMSKHTETARAVSQGPIRRLLSVGGATALVTALLVAAGGTAAPTAHAAVTEDYLRQQIFTYTGTSAEFQIPEGVSEVKALVWGAGGGGVLNDGAANQFTSGGGGGGYVEGTISGLVSGEHLNIQVGQGGVTGEANLNLFENPTFGGGGSGGAVFVDGESTNVQWGSNGAAGGGASSVSLGALNAQNALLVAGGGGGSTGLGSVTGPELTAGGGGYPAGGSGGAVARAGQGGNQTTGGAKAADTQCEPDMGDYPMGQEDGSAFRGGAGAEPNGEQAAPHGGGGGGGGYFGGGGGNCINDLSQTAQGIVPGVGGGGSSYYDSDRVSSFQFENGANGLRGSASVIPAGGVAKSAADFVTSAVGTGGGFADSEAASAGANGLVVIQWNQPPDWEKSSFTVSEGEQPVGTGNHTITVYVKEATGAPVDLTEQDLALLNATVDLPFAPETQIGPFSRSATGEYVADISSTMAGKQPVEVTFDGQPLLPAENAYALFVAGQPNSDCGIGDCSRMWSDQGTHLADGDAQGEVYVQLVDRFGNAVADFDVQFDAPDLSPSSQSVRSDDSGLAVASFVSTAVGVFPVSASAAGQAITDGNPANLEFVPGDAQPRFSVDPDPAVADGDDAVVLTIESFDQLVPPHPVELSTDDLSVVLWQNDEVVDVVDVGDFVPTATPFEGHYEAPLTTTVAGKYDVEVSYQGQPVPEDDNDIASFIAGAVDYGNENTRIYGEPGFAGADGLQTRVITAELFDSFDNPVSDQTVSFQNGDLGDQSGVTDASGKVEVEYTSAVPGVFQVSGTVGAAFIANGELNDGGVGYGLARFKVGDPDPEGSTFHVDPTPQTADGQEFAKLTLRLQDESGHPIEDFADWQAVNVVADPGNGVAVKNAFAAGVAPGEYTMPITSTVAGSKTISVTLDGAALGSDANIANFVPGAVSFDTSSYWVSNDPGVLADGIGIQTVNVRLQDAQGNAISGREDSLSVTAPGLISGENWDYVDGTYTAPLTSLQAGEFHVEAAFESTNLRALSMLDSTTFVAGPPDAQTSTFTVSEKANVPADGTSTQIVTVDLQDAHGNPASLPDSWTIAGTATTASGAQATVGAFAPVTTGRAAGGSTLEAPVTSLLPGDFKVTIQMQGQSISKTGNDIARFVAVKSAPPTVTELAPGGAKGTGVPGATITITGPGGNEICVTEVQPNGKWSCEFSPKLEVGQKVSVTQTEVGKTPSDPVNYLIPKDGVTPKPVEPNPGSTANTGAQILATAIAALVMILGGAVVLLLRRRSESR